jgi:hypothetical protein
MLDIDFSDIYSSIGKRRSANDYMDRSLAAPNIALGFLDTIGKPDGSALRQAVQHTANAAQARDSEAAGRMAAQEQNEFNTMMGRQRDLYAAEGNARMMLLQKSNELAKRIDEIEGGYDYDDNPERYQELLDRLIGQKSEIDGQLGNATEALKNNPLYQGETLVDPVRTQRNYNSEQRKGMSSELDKRLMAKMKELPWQDLINLNSTDTTTELASDIKLTNADKSNAFQRIKNELMANHEGLLNYQMNQLKIGQAYRDNTISKKEFENKMINLAIERYESNAELNSIAQKSATQEEFENNIKGSTVLQEINKISGLNGSQIKSILNGIWRNTKRERGNAGDL